MATFVKAGYWMAYNAHLCPLESIESNLFTHLFFAFVDDLDKSYRVFIPTHFKDFASRFTDVLRRKNPAIKTLLSIGGGGNDTITDKFIALAKSHASREAFIRSSIEVARANNFDGLDLDYEIPKTGEDMANLGTLLREWKKSVDGEARPVNKPPLLLTAAVRYNNYNYSDPRNPYPAQDIINSLDWINVMAYDFTSPSLWGSPNNTGPTGMLYNLSNPGVSGSGGVNAWIDGAGLPRKKIVLGIPFYGYAWKLRNQASNGYGALADGPAMTEDGNVSYRKIVDFIGRNRAVVKYDEGKVGAYCYAGTTWISYDNDTAVKTKVRFARDQGLLGYFSWEVCTDDNSALARAAADA